MSEEITVEAFEKRIVELCLQSGSSDLPRRPRDQHILMKSVVLTLDASAEYSESEIDKKLLSWLRNIAPSIGVDHVNLRRVLVDKMYLGRSRDGSRYWVGLHVATHLVFEPEVEDLDIDEVIRKGRDEIEQRKQEYFRQRPDTE